MRPDAPLAELRHPLLELGLLDGLALAQRRGRVVDHGEQLVDQAGGGGPGAVELVGHGGPGLAPQRQARVGGQQPGPTEIAGRGRGRLAGRVGRDPLGHQPLDDGDSGTGPEVDAHAARGDRDQLGRHLLGQHDEDRARRRLLDGLQQVRPALRRTRWNSSSTSTLRVPSTGDAAGPVDDARGPARR